MAGCFGLCVGRIALMPVLLLSSLTSQAEAVTLKVPQDFRTIQAAIDAAQNGDTVIVAPGTYVENINAQGKAITVASTQGPSQTTIDGGEADSVATFVSGEGASTVLSGFTIRNGFARNGEGGGVRIEFSSPTITDNVIAGNGACAGAGVSVGFGSPLIQRNTIRDNAQRGCTGGIGGGGISVRGVGSARILDNVISSNRPGADGGGIALFAAGTPTIQGNFINGNTAPGQGGGISMVNVSDADIINNVIVGNRATAGGGVAWLASGGRGPRLVNNTITDNDGGPEGGGFSGGSAIFVFGFDAQTVLVNNLMVGKPGQTTLLCGDLASLQPPMLQFNDVYVSSGRAYGGGCADQTGLNGNISADPLFAFVSPSGGNYRLRPGSPAIDAGTNSAPSLPPTDLDGGPRVRDGDGSGSAMVDMGAYEAALESPVPVARSAFAADFDGDGRADLVTWNSTTGVWSILESGTGTSRSVVWGATGDVPVPGDYDGDGKADVAVWRPSTGAWFIIDSSTGVGRGIGWGAPGDVPVPGDYDGDGRTDLAVYRPSTGAWFIIDSSTGVGRGIGWGAPGDVPVPGDYDGDGKTDVAVWRPSTGTWFIVDSSTGLGRISIWSGPPGDVPVPGDYDGDGKTDLALYQRSTGAWLIIDSGTGTGRGIGWGGPDDLPVPGDFTGDRRTDIAVYRLSTGHFFIRPPGP